MLRLPGRELAQEGLELAGLAGGFQLCVEEVLGPDAEIVANAEKAGHGGQGPAVFDLVDIALALAQGQAHIPGGNALLHPELDQPLGEPLCVIHRYHLLHILYHKLIFFKSFFKLFRHLYLLILIFQGVFRIL